MASFPRIKRFSDSFGSLFGVGKRHLPPTPLNQSDVIGADDLQASWMTGSAFWNPNLETGTDRQGTYMDLHEGLRDPQSASCLDLRCQIASSLPWQLVAQEGTSPEAMTLTQYVLEGIDFAGYIEQMVKSSYYGLTALELFWRSDDPAHPGRLIPWDFAPFDLQYVWFTQDRQVTINGRTPETGKVILHRTGAHFRNPYGLGRGRTVPQWVRVKKAISLATFRDFGSHIHDKIHFTYPDGADSVEVAKYMATAQAAMAAPALLTREAMKATPIRLESNFEVGVKLIDACDAQIAKAILGNTLTTGEGRHGTQALGGVHESMTDKQTWADGLRVETTLNNTLIPWITQANFPSDVPPKIVFDASVKPAMLERLKAVLGASAFQDKDGNPLEISGAWLRETFGIPAPDEEMENDAFILKVAPPPTTPEPAAPGVKEPMPTLAAKTSSEKRSEAILDRWLGQWRSRVAGPHRTILGALGDGEGSE